MKETSCVFYKNYLTDAPMTSLYKATLLERFGVAIAWGETKNYYPSNRIYFPFYQTICPWMVMILTTWFNRPSFHRFSGILVDKLLVINAVCLWNNLTPKWGKGKIFDKSIPDDALDLLKTLLNIGEAIMTFVECWLYVFLVCTRMARPMYLDFSNIDICI